jgi:hypothetical protein
VWIVAGSRFGYALELPDQKAQGFLVLIVLKQLFLEHIRKVFCEISVRIWIEFLSDLSSSVLHVFLPTLIHISTAVPNPVLRANNFSIAMRSWTS